MGPQPLVKTTSYNSHGQLQLQDANAANDADPMASSMSGTSSSSQPSITDRLTHVRKGRRYFRDSVTSYPLPVDIAEIHRQTLKTLMLVHVLGAPFCSPVLEERPPKHVLEIGCGSGLWSSCCHDYFASDGHADVSFTGIDILPLPPDLSKKGMRWQYVQHDFRKPRLPFADRQFDFIFLKDLGFTADKSVVGFDPMAEPIRLLKPGGVLEVWETDHLFRTLLPNPSVPPGVPEEDQEQADETATYTVFSGTPFTGAQNRYLQNYNTWMQKILTKLGFNPIPSVNLSLNFTMTPCFSENGSRRIAIPLGEVRWEREDFTPAEVEKPTRKGSIAGLKGKSKAIEQSRKNLNAEQMAIRRTALLTVVQWMESLEPLLKEASEKSQDEWDRWWSAMTSDLLQGKGTTSGECLEVSAWWGQKDDLGSATR